MEPSRARGKIQLFVPAKSGTSTHITLWKKNVFFENACYHIPGKGNSRQKFLADKLDRKTFLNLVISS